MGLRQINPGGQGVTTGDPVTDEQLEQIGIVANDAKVIAQAAKTSADESAIKAETATVAADGYSAAIDNAVSLANTAKSAADAATAAADVASAKADAVTDTAADAESVANAAALAANTAAGKADDAKATADGLAAAVSAIDTKATDAKTAADAATAAVAGAVTKADAAQAAADSASSVANSHESRIDDLETLNGNYSQLIAEATAVANNAIGVANSAEQVANSLEAEIAASIDASSAAATAAGNAEVKAQAAIDGIVGLEDDIAAIQIVANEANDKANDANNAIATAMGDLELAISSQVTRIDDLETSDSDHETRLLAIEANTAPTYDDTALAARVTATEAKNSTQDGDIAALQGAVVSGGGATLMPYLSAWGDSRTSQNYSSGGGLLSRGYVFWAELLSGRCRAHQKYNFGVSGDTIAMLYARMSGDVANSKGVKPSEVPPSHAVLFIGTNTVVNYSPSIPTLASMMIEYNQCVDWLIARGHTVYVIAEWPRGVGVEGILQSANQKLMHAFAREIRKLALTKKVTVIDCWPAMADPALATAQPLLGYINGDGVHPTPGSGFLTGKLIAEALKQNNARKIAFPASNQGLYDATYNKEGCLNSNPMLRGSGGTMSAGSGIVPDGWTVSLASGVTGLSCVGSNVTVTMPDGTKRQAYRMVISGTPNVINSSILLRVPSALRAAAPWNGNIADGDTIEGGAEIIVSDGHVNLNAVSCSLVTDSTSTSSLAGYFSSGSVLASGQNSADTKWPDSLIQGYSGIVRTPEYPWISAYTKLQFEIRPFFVEIAPCSVTIDILSAWVRKKV